MGALDPAQISLAQRNEWISARYLMPSGHVRAWARIHLARLAERTSADEQLWTLIQTTAREPVHSVVLSADRYPNDPLQQIRITLSAIDGFGRPSQTQQREIGRASWRDRWCKYVSDSVVAVTLKYTKYLKKITNK